MLATDSLQHPLCSDTLLSTSCREEFIMKQSFVQSPFCAPTALSYLLAQQEGPGHTEQSVHREPPALLCPPGWKTSSRNLINLLFAAPSPTKHFSFFPRRHFKSSAHSSEHCSPHRHCMGPGCPHWALSQPHSAPWLHFCQGSHCTTTDKLHLFSLFCPPFCHVSRSCLCNPGSSRLREKDKARIQGGKGWITPELFSEQDSHPRHCPTEAELC